jgi:hypothetical protein
MSGNTNRQVTSEELDALYRGIGRGVWNLQYVEDTLQTLITIMVEIRTPGRVTASEGKALLAKHRRNTLGTSLKIVREQSLVGAELLDRLSRFKEERDWLIHRSQQSHGDLLYTDMGREEIFRRLEGFEEEASLLQKAVLKEIDAFAASRGVDVAAAQALAVRNVGRMRGKLT